MRTEKQTVIPGVMLNAYPESIGNKLGDILEVLEKPDFEDVFSLFYILPTFFHSDLDRGFSIIDYDINEELVDAIDLEAMKQMGLQLKCDIVLNHLSVASPQFKDLLEHGDASRYKDFFIDWNAFWSGFGEVNQDGVVVPHKEYLDKLFMRKPGLPVLKVLFPDGTERPYWNTFYQSISYQKIEVDDLKGIPGIDKTEACGICEEINAIIDHGSNPTTADFELSSEQKKEVLRIVNNNRHYLGQMDVNARSPQVWAFYEDVLTKVKNYGCKILRLDAFAYLHKEVGQSNFFNTVGTWEYLSRFKDLADKHDFILLPEIHAEYGSHLHDEVAAKGYYIYDFFLPGLIIHAIEKGTAQALMNWGQEIIDKGFRTVNMLGCHDGIPVLDLKGKEVDGVYNEGLLKDDEIEDLIELILKRGGRVKNLYGPGGEKVSYYQVNATYFSALGENEDKLLLARALQMFMPGIPQVWYLDIFAGKNDYEAADRAGSGGHKEINRTNLTLEEVRDRMERTVVQNQLRIIKLRNTSKAFMGGVTFRAPDDAIVEIKWTNGNDNASLIANLGTLEFEIRYSDTNGDQKLDLK